MRTNRNTGVDEREQWKARILRALAELRHEDTMLGSATRQGEAREDDESGRNAP